MLDAYIISLLISKFIVLIDFKAKEVASESDIEDGQEQIHDIHTFDFRKKKL